MRSTAALAAPWFVGAALGLDVLSTFYVGDQPMLVARLEVAAGGGLDGLAMGELSARIEAVLRRAGEKTVAKELYDDGTVCIDFAARSVTVRDETVSLTPLEFRLLAALTEHTGRVLSRQELIELVWGRSYESSGDPVKIYIGYLRKKIEEDPGSPRLVETVRGFGYRYVSPE